MLSSVDKYVISDLFWDFIGEDLSLENEDNLVISIFLEMQSYATGGELPAYNAFSKIIKIQDLKNRGVSDYGLKAKEIDKIIRKLLFMEVFSGDFIVNNFNITEHKVLEDKVIEVLKGMMVEFPDIEESTFAIIKRCYYAYSSGNIYLTNIGNSNHIKSLILRDAIYSKKMVVLDELLASMNREIDNTKKVSFKLNKKIEMDRNEYNKNVMTMMSLLLAAVALISVNLGAFTRLQDFEIDDFVLALVGGNISCGFVITLIFLLLDKVICKKRRERKIEYIFWTFTGMTILIIILLFLKSTL